MGPWWPVLLLYLPAGLLALMTTIVSWRRRTSGGVPPLVLIAIMASVTVWAAAMAVRAVTAPSAVASAALVLVPVCAGTVSGAILILARALRHRNWWPRRRLVALLAVEPVLLLVLGALPATRSVVFTDYPDGHRAWGWGFWAHGLYSYVLIGAAGVILFRTWRSAVGPFRAQALTVLLGGFAPLVANVLTVLLSARGRTHDFSVLGFSVTGLLYAWALFRQELFRLVPVARELVIDTIGDAVIVVDVDGRVVDLNPAAVTMLRALDPTLPAELVGLPGGRLKSSWAGGGPVTPGEHHLVVGGRDLELDVRIDPLSGTRGQDLGRVVVVRDITEQKLRERELATANAQLTEQLETIEQLRAELLEQATRDVLTGLHNRRHLSGVLMREAAAAAEGGGPLSVVILDLDHFKAINDRYGHAIGDRFLSAAGAELARLVRAGDTVGRWGGEEFVAVLPGAARAEATALADRLREAFAQVTVQSREGPVRTTLSAGVAEIVPGSTTDELLEAADSALYEAKAAGRNRVVAAGDPAEPDEALA